MKQPMYRAFFNVNSISMWHPNSAADAFFNHGELSECGKFVETRRVALNKHRYETHIEHVSWYWHPTRAKALAAVAGRLRQIGETLVAQANEWERGAQDEINDRPALAEAAESLQPHGSPSGSGE